MKKNKGITLIALVVTIIVLIILAGISISLILGNNGIITRARDAKENYLRASNEEKDNLDSLYAEMDEKIGQTEEPIEPIEPIEITNNTETLTILRGNTAQIEIEQTGTVENKTYTSSNTSIATVNNNGLVTASSTNTGTATINVELTNTTGGRATASINVTVNSGVARLNNTKDFPTLASACLAQNTGAVTLLQNISENFITLDGSAKNITIDLGGKTWSGNDAGVGAFNGAKFTISNGTINTTGERVILFANGVGSEMTINSGNYNMTAGSGSWCPTVGSYRGATVTINGGTISGGYYMCVHSSIEDRTLPQTNIYIYGGTFNNKLYAQLTGSVIHVYDGVFNNGFPSATSGGTIYDHRGE